MVNWSRVASLGIASKSGTSEGRLFFWSSFDNSEVESLGLSCEGAHVLNTLSFKYDPEVWHLVCGKA